MADIILGLIVKYGIPLAEKIWLTVNTAGQPTPAMWADLKKLNEEWTMEKYLAEAEKKTPVQ